MSRLAAALAVLALGGVLDAGCHCTRRGNDAAGSGSAETSETTWPSNLPPLRFERRTPETGPPRSFRLHPDVVITAEDFIARYAKPLWGLSAADELRPAGMTKEDTGSEHTTYVQWHAGYTVEGGSFVLTTRAGRVVSGGGVVLGGLDEIELGIRVPKETAVERAEERMASALGVNKDALHVYGEPEARLMIVEKQRRLAWRVLVRTLPLAARSVTVDAETGEVLSEQDLTRMP
jgi:hypothetical protein